MLVFIRKQYCALWLQIKLDIMYFESDGVVSILELSCEIFSLCRLASWLAWGTAGGLNTESGNITMHYMMHYNALHDATSHQDFCILSK